VLNWDWDLRDPLLVVLDEEDPFRGESHVSSHPPPPGRVPLVRTIKRSDLWEWPVKGAILSADRSLAFAAYSSARMAAVLRLDGPRPTVLGTIALGDSSFDSYGELEPVHCSAIFHEGGLVVMQSTWNGGTAETVLLRFLVDDSGVREVLRTRPIFDVCHVIAVSPLGCYVAVRCQQSSGVKVTLAEKFAEEEGLVIGEGQRVSDIRYLEGSRPSGFVVEFPRSVAVWRLDDGRGAVQEWSVSLDADLELQGIYPLTGRGVFILAERADRRWAVFRDGVLLLPDVDAALPLHEQTGRFAWLQELGSDGAHALLIRGTFRDGAQNRFQVDLLE
jgi:hypothetical protein